MSAAHSSPQAPLLLEALRLLDRGWSMIPVKADKRPAVSEWKPYQQRCASAAELTAWAKLNPPAWAVVTGAVSQLVVLDFDGEKGQALLVEFGMTPHTRTGSGGSHLYLAHPGFTLPTLNAKSAKNSWPWPGLDVRADGGYAVALGSSETGPYTRLRDPEPDAWETLPRTLRDLLKGWRCAPPAEPFKKPPRSTQDRIGSERLIQRALEMAPRDGRNNSGAWLAAQLRDNGYPQSEALGVMRDYRARVPQTNSKGQNEPYGEREVSATVQSIYSRVPRESWGRRVRSIDVSVKNSESAEPPPPPPNLLTGFDPEDVGTGQRVIAMYGDQLRYCHAFQKWLFWDGRVWRVDECDHARTLAQKTMTEFALQSIRANNDSASKFAVQCRRSARLSNALREAQPHLSIAPDDLDTHPFLLNFMNGVVDLRTGTLQPHDRSLFITKLIHHRYNPAAKCPVFMSFLSRIMGDNPDASEADLTCTDRLIKYLQRALGYTLTASTAEKVVFLLHGRGDNGKSTLLSTFMKLISEYSVLLQIDTLMVRQESNNTQADLADLRGARFVMTSETEEGQRLAEGKLKRITQGLGRIKATRKYENPVEFDESHKLWIDANHLPLVRGHDDAIWNRLHPVPFSVVIPKDQQDKRLSTRLATEAEGILAWAVQGAMEWSREGLGTPVEISQAGAEWRAESNQIGRFLEDVCVLLPNAQVPARRLYNAYRQWAEETGERTDTETSFGKKISDHGFTKIRKGSGTVYIGIGMRIPDVGSVGL